MDELMQYLRNHFKIPSNLTISIEHQAQNHKQFNVFNPVDGGLADVILTKFYHDGKFFYAGYCAQNQRLYIVDSILS